MIAPRLRLVLTMLFVTVPLATVAGLNEGLLPISLLLIGVPIVVGLFDLAVSIARYRTLEFSFPEVIRGIVSESAQLEIRGKHNARKNAVVRLGVVFPDGLEPEREQERIPLNKTAREVVVRLPFVGRSRGTYRIQDLYFEWNSPLKFWVHRERRAIQCEVRIYPNLRFEGKQVARFLTRGATGLHARPQVGRGREFEHLREYEQGDSFDEIHWKATAKRRFPVTKIFQLERSQEIYVAVDTSRLSARPLPEPFSAGRTRKMTTHLDRAICAALLLCVAAQRQGDRFGFICFSDRVNHLFKARSGPSHFNTCRELTLSLYPQSVSPDFSEIVATVKNRVKRRSLIVFLTSLDDPVMAEDFVATVGLLSKQHLVLAIMIASNQLQPLFSGDVVDNVDDVYLKLSGHLRWARLQNLQRVLARKAVQFNVVPNHRAGIDLVSHYMNLKRRQVL
jgi:uncharacterized protein (DUF58 family)